jgi:hypothetical protein
VVSRFRLIEDEKWNRTISKALCSSFFVSRFHSVFCHSTSDLVISFSCFSWTWTSSWFFVVRNTRSFALSLRKLLSVRETAALMRIPQEISFVDRVRIFDLNDISEESDYRWNSSDDVSMRNFNEFERKRIIVFMSTSCVSSECVWSAAFFVRLSLILSSSGDMLIRYCLMILCKEDV